MNDHRTSDIVHQNIHEVLLRFWGYSTFRPLQEDIIRSVLENKDTLALMPTGGGKSTIVNLICRFFEPKSGKILINGVDYTQLTQHAIQSRVGIVLQTPHLFESAQKHPIELIDGPRLVDLVSQALGPGARRAPEPSWF